MSTLLLPFKTTGLAKQRLASFLSGDERERLARCMLSDVARALSGSRMLRRVVFLTADQWAGDFALSQGWELIREEQQHSESRSVDWASRQLAAEGVDSLLRIPCDIPLVSPRDIDALLKISIPKPGALLVPSRTGEGTNLLLRRPPDLFPSRFGPDSLRRHRREADRIGAPLQVVRNPRIELDLDEPSDLEAFIPRGEGTQTWGFMKSAGIIDRLNERKEPSSP